MILVLVTTNSMLQAQTRIDMPDGEAVVAVNSISIATPPSTVRLAATRGMVYASAYIGGAWTRNTSVIEVPVNRRIVDASLRFGENGDTRSYGLLLDNGDVMVYTFDLKTMSLKGTPELIPTPFTPQTGGFGQQTYKKLLLNSSIIVHFSNSVFINLQDGNGYTLDSAGLNRANVQDIALDNKANLIAATSRGVWTWNLSTTRWSRLPGFDSSLSATSIFATRDGRAFASTQNRGTFSTTLGSGSWTMDSTGLSGASLARYCDDASNVVFASANTSNTTSQLFRHNGSGPGWTRIDSAMSLVAGGVLRINDLSAEQTLECASTIGCMSSKQAGVDWSNTTAGIVAEDIYGLQFYSGGVSVVSTGLGMYRKNLTWSQTFPQSGFNGTRPLYRADNPSTLAFQLAQTANVQPTIYTSLDQGATWTVDTASLSNVPAAGNNGSSVFGLDMNAKKIIAVGNPIGFYSASPWALDTVGFVGSNGTGVAAAMAFYADPLNNTYLSGGVYVGGGGGGFTIRDIILNRRAAGSAQWTTDTNGLNKAPITAFAATKTATYAGSSLVGGTAQLFKRGASSWQNIPAPPTAVSDTRAMCIDSNGVLYVAYTATINNNSPNRGVYATSDNGTTWEYAGLDSVTVRGLVATTDGVYAFTNRGAFKLSRSPLRAASIQFNKHVIDFGLVDVGSKKDTMITVSNSGNDTLRVSNMRTNSANFTVSPNTFSVAPGASKDVTVSFQPTVGGALSTTMRSVANTTPDTLYLTGRGKAADVKILLDDSFIDMGVVDIGTTKDSTIKVGNGGTDTLVVGSVNSSNATISATPKTFRVAPGDHQDLTIHFTPTAVGGVIAFLRFVNNGPGDSIRILGNGEIASIDDPSMAREYNLFLTPNPTTGSDAQLHFTLNSADFVSISLLNERGQIVRDILNARREAAEYSIALAESFRGLSDGVYFIRLSNSSGQSTLKCVVQH